uniref:Uncharacterized protein n=1 Tax=Oryza glumipatula TaxID=40148 RepID=A0A0E0AZ96_9ORYZ
MHPPLELRTEYEAHIAHTSFNRASDQAVLQLKESGEWRGLHLGDLDDAFLFEELGEALAVDVVGRLHVLADLLYVLRLLRNFRGGLDGFLLLIISSAASSASGTYPSSWSNSSGTSDSSAAPGSAKSSAAADDEEDWKESDAASCASERQRVERMWRRGVDGERRNGAEEEGEGLGRKASVAAMAQSERRSIRGG